MTKETGGPAFPCEPVIENNPEARCSYTGMTLRVWLAAHAPPMPQQWFEDSPRKKTDPLWHWGEASAAWAFFYADAMLAEMSKP